MEVIITNRKVVKHSLMALVILAALTQMALADITVTAPEDTADPLFTQPVPQTWHFGSGDKKASASTAIPAQEQNSVTVTVKTLPRSKAQ